MGAQGRWGVGVVCGLLWAVPAAAQVVINEVLPDPAGRDAGQEFVELYNPSTQDVSLAGVVVESWHGAKRGWVRAWGGDSGTRCRARGFLLIAGADLAGSADGSLDSDLTNSSGAVRLRGPRSVGSVVGWGPLTDPGLFEGAPCGAPAAGHSLARVPDGANSGRTASDLREAATPTPRASNGRLGPVLAAVPLAVTPALPWPGRAAVVRVRLAVVGEAAAATGGFTLRVSVASPDAPDSALDLVTLPAVLAAHETTEVAVPWTPAASGSWRLRVWLIGPDGDTLRGAASCRAGLGALEISEVMAVPRPGEPDWIECVNTSDAPMRLGEFVLVTPRHASVALPGRALAPGERVVLCATAAAMLGAYPTLDAATCVELGTSFPALPAREATDQPPVECAVAGPDGVLSDWVPYGLLKSHTGHSWERFDPTLPPDDPLGWQVSADARGGTPGAANSARPSSDAGAPHLRVEASTAVAGRIAWVDLGVTPCDGGLSVCSLSGRRVAEVTRFTQARGQIRVPLALDGAQLAPGIYALVLDVRRGAARGVDRRAVSLTVGP